MGLLGWILLGLIAGWIASVIMGTRHAQGIIGDIFLGVIGALIGGLVASSLGIGSISGFNLYSLAIATLGAVGLIALKQQFA